MFNYIVLSKNTILNIANNIQTSLYTQKAV